MGAPTDLSGLTFGDLTVIKKTGNSPSGALWECRCKCGRLTEKITSKVKRDCVCKGHTGGGYYLHGHTTGGTQHLERILLGPI